MSGKEIEKYKYSDVLSAETLNRPLNELQEDLDAENTLISEFLQSNLINIEDENLKNKQCIIFNNVLKCFGYEIKDNDKKNNEEEGNEKKSNDENDRGKLPIKQINYKDTKKSIVKIPTGAFFFNKNIYNTKTNFIVNYPDIEQGIEDIASALEIDINNKFNKINIEYDDFLDQYTVSCTLTIYDELEHVFKEKKISLEGPDTYEIICKDQYEIFNKLSKSLRGTSGLIYPNINLETWVDCEKLSGNDWLIYNLETEQYSFKQENDITENDVKLYQVSKQLNELSIRPNNTIEKYFNLDYFYCNNIVNEQIDSEGTSSKSSSFDNTNIDSLIVKNSLIIDNVSVKQGEEYFPIKVSEKPNNSFKLKKDGFYSNLNIPIGCVIPFAGQNIPSTFLLCDGSTVRKDVYLDLFNVIGYTYGGSDNEFKLPDLRELVPVGVGTNETYNIASHDVYEVGEFKDDQMQTHAHNYQSVYTTGGNAAGRDTDKNVLSPTVNSETTKDINDNLVTHGKQIGVNYIIYVGAM